MPPRSCPTCDSPRCGNHAACARKREAEIRDFARRATEAVQWHADWCALWATIDVAERALAAVDPSMRPFFLSGIERLSIEHFDARSFDYMRAATDIVARGKVF